MRRTVLGAGLALTLMAVSCGEGVATLDSGAGPSGSSSSVSQATPTPAPTATQSPTPSAGLTCTLPSLPHCDDKCCTAGGTVLFVSELELAEADLYKNQPNLFQSNGQVKNNFEYLAALAKRLTELTGLCAEANAHDEIRVKRDQTVSQHIDVLIGDVTPWVGGAYTCRPASF